MTSRVTFVTPTYDRDLQRFTLLRESMEKCEIDIPHVAVVDDEDLPLFREMPFRHKLTLISSKDALPTRIEQRRAMPAYRRRHPYYWIKPRNIHGWGAQQLMKLCAPQYIETEGILCLDSDVFFVDRVEEKDFFSDDGKLHLYENDCEYTVETIYWMAQSMKALNVPLGQKPYLYVHNPVPLHREVVLALQRELSRVHDRNWIDVFLENDLTEYTTYGVFARYVNGLYKVAPVKPPFTLNYWSNEQLEGYTDTLLGQIRSQGARVVCINSAIGRPVSEYRSLVENVWAANGR